MKYLIFTKAMKHLLFLLFSFSMTAQINGIVKDSLSGNPIPYVNIWVENENIGTNSESDGTFSLDLKTEKNLVFSALGFETKIVKSTAIETVFLLPKMYELEEVVVSIPRNTQEILVGNSKKRFYLPEPQVVPWILAKKISLVAKNSDLNHLKKLIFYTNSEVENGKFRLRIFSVDEKGYPKNDLVTDEIIIGVKKGKKKTIYDVANLHIDVPTEGIFVGFESLIIEENKYNQTANYPASKKPGVVNNYSPHILYYYAESEISYAYRRGKWVKNIFEMFSIYKKKQVLAPAIDAILSN